MNYRGGLPNPPLAGGGGRGAVGGASGGASQPRAVRARVHLFGVAAGHALRGAGAGVGRAALLSGQGRKGERGRAAPTQRAVSAVPPCGGAYAHHRAELRLPADAALSHACAGAYRA